MEDPDAALVAASGQDRLDEERAAGKLFGELFDDALVEAHPVATSLDEYFGEFEVSDDVYERVRRSTPAVEAAGSGGTRLARFGLTPLDILHVADAAADQLEHVLGGWGTAEPGAEIELTEDGLLQEPSGGMPSDVLIQEAADVTALDEAAAQAVLRWLLRLTEAMPSLFLAFSAEPTARGTYRFRYTGEDLPLAKRVRLRELAA